jgi:predicted transcriptional regulator YdeE
MDKNPIELTGEKADLWRELQADGRWAALKAKARGPLEFGINEAVDGQFMYYAGVFTDEVVEDATRVINFPAGEYLVIRATGKGDEIWGNLDMAAFGEILPQAEDFAYVGGPNANVMFSEEDGIITGQKWIPIVRK